MPQPVTWFGKEAGGIETIVSISIETKAMHTRTL